MWRLVYKGETKTFQEWGIKHAVRRLLSLDIDVFQFEVPSEIVSDAQFDRGEVITVFNGDKKWFQGPIDQTPANATGRYESDGYVVVGAWWYLAQLTYQQHWKELANPLNPADGFVTKYRSHLLLGVDVTGLYLTTKAILIDVLNYCLACAAENQIPAPFQIGEIAIPEFVPIINELLNRACSEVIYQMLRWTPDAVAIVDYTTTPPTLNIRQRSGLTKTSFKLPEDDLRNISLRPRKDIQVPEVVIKYEITNLVDGLAYSQLIEDKAPLAATGRKFGSLIHTINLEGGSISYCYSQIVCDSIDLGATGNLDWWKANNKIVGSPQVKNLKITDPVSQTNLPLMLVSGTIAPWMLGNGKDAQRDVIQAKAEFDIMADDGLTVSEHKKDVEIEVEITATNLTSGTYKTIESQTLAEPVPVGLAGYLFAATGVLHYDGSFEILEDECSGKASIGNLINITGARAEYATMDAVVQSISEDIDSGVTTVVVGPPKHLGADDIIEFLRANRTRIRLTPASSLSTGKSFAATPVALGVEAPVKNTNAANGTWDLLTVAQKFIIDRADNPQNREVRFREFPFCDDFTDPSQPPRKRWIGIWCTLPYDK